MKKIKRLCIFALMIMVISGTTNDIQTLLAPSITTAKEVALTIKNGVKDAEIIVNNNIPEFTEEEKQNTSTFEYYSELDELGRCGVAYANICKELMPTEERTEIGHIKPSGWVQAKYDVVDSNPGYLYNRCHLIAFCLAGENDNPKNLITGTRFMNVELILPYETKILNYMKKYPDNHVLYRVTPAFDRDYLVASGVKLEAWSVEDNGKLHFNVYVKNIQPGVVIDYATGKSILEKVE